MTSPLSIEQEADALEALEKQAIPGPWERHDHGKGGFCVLEPASDCPVIDIANGHRVFMRPEDAEFIVALRNRALPIIRALRERVKKLDRTLDEHAKLYEGQRQGWAADQARLESVEAERDIWRERAQVHGLKREFEGGGLIVTAYPDPTPAEIQARIVQKRREAGIPT